MRNILGLWVVVSLAVWGGCSQKEEVVPISPTPATSIIRVPADQPTIQAAIDTARAGDTILVADGRYEGEGSQDITFGGKSVVLKSENGPSKTSIVITADSVNYHFAFELTQSGETNVVIDGFTVIGAYSSQGSVLNLRSVSPTIKNCVFVDNRAVTSGGVARCKNASPTFINCTFYGNSAPTGAIVYLLAGSSPQFVNCILASSTGGDVVVCSDDLCLPTFSCTDIYGNEGGDWLECISTFEGTDGNISLDPLFCDPESRDFRLQSSSPCTAENSGCGETIGALAGGCSD